MGDVITMEATIVMGITIMEADAFITGTTITGDIATIMDGATERQSEDTATTAAEVNIAIAIATATEITTGTITDPTTTITAVLEGTSQTVSLQ
jgi:hypothetical protein